MEKVLNKVKYKMEKPEAKKGGGGRERIVF